MMVPAHLTTLPPLAYRVTADSVLASFFLGAANMGNVAKRATRGKKLVIMVTQFCCSFENAALYLC